MTLVIGGLAPHPPLLVPQVGGDRLYQIRATRHALQRLAADVVAARPDRLVMVTPHGPHREAAITAMVPETLQGDMGRFGAGEVKQEFAVDRALTEAVAEEAQRRRVRVQLSGEQQLDHGLMVPLHYLSEAGLRVPLVAFSTGGIDFGAHFRLGQILASVLAERPGRVAVVVSGDLSHRLLETGPYGFDEMGPRFDELVVKGLAPLDVDGLCAIPAEIVSRAGVCGYKPLGVLLGALPTRVDSQVLSYEGPFGVGYAVARVSPRSERRTILLDLARRTVEAHARGESLPRPAPEELPEWLGRPAACFVTLRKQGDLRGCIGTVAPLHDDLATELIRNALGACSRDPRFVPVEEHELELLEYAVYVLGEAEPAAGLHELDPERYGVIVRLGRRTGVLLPGIPQIETPGQQVEIALRKGGIGADQDFELLRFEVEKFPEGAD